MSLIKTGSSLAKALEKEDLNRYLGSTLAGNQLNRRIQALTRPADYETALRDEIKKGQDSAEAEYKRVFNAYYEAGLDVDTAKAIALQASKRSYEVSMDATRVLFPESQTGIYTLGAKLASTSNTPFGALTASEILKQ